MTDTTTVQPASEPALQPGQQPAPAEPSFGVHPGSSAPASATAAPYAPYLPLPGRWNPLALAAFAAAFIAPVVAIVFGHLALRDLRWNGERGQKLAFWGVVLGYVFSALLVVGGVVAIIASAHHGFGDGRVGGFGGQGGFGTGGGTGGFGSGGGTGGGFGGGFPGQGYGTGQGGASN